MRTGCFQPARDLSASAPVVGVNPPFGEAVLVDEEFAELSEGWEANSAVCAAVPVTAAPLPDKSFGDGD
jgi:hypothetical protein